MNQKVGRTVILSVEADQVLRLINASPHVVYLGTKLEKEFLLSASLSLSSVEGFIGSEEEVLRR